MHIPAVSVAFVLLFAAGCTDASSDAATDTTSVLVTTGSPITTEVDGGAGQYGDLLTALDAAEAKWEATAISDYVLTYSPSCFCRPDIYSVTVRGGEIEESSSESGREPLPSGTVAGWFDTIRQAARDDAEAIQVQFDPALGFPVEFWIDVDLMIADEEFGVSGASVEVLAD